MHSNVMLMIRCTTRSPVNTLIRSFDRYQKLNFYSFADLFKGFPVIDSIIFQKNPNEVGQRFSKIFLFGYRSFFWSKFDGIYHMNVICGTNLWLNHLWKTTIACFVRLRVIEFNTKNRLHKNHTYFISNAFFSHFPPSFFYYIVEINWTQLRWTSVKWIVCWWVFLLNQLQPSNAPMFLSLYLSSSSNHFSDLYIDPFWMARFFSSLRWNKGRIVCRVRLINGRCIT